MQLQKIHVDRLNENFNVCSKEVSEEVAKNAEFR